MNYELIVLKSFLDRLTYDKYRSAINLSFTRQNAPEIHVLFTVLDQVYSSTEVAALTVGELEALTFSEFPYLKPVEQEVYRDLFKRLEEIECHPDLVEQVLLKAKQRHAAHQIALAALEAAEGRREYASLVETFNAASEGAVVQVGDESEVFVTTDLKEIYDQQVSTPGLRWRLGSLNRRLGSLRKGDFGFLFARPERGKTTFLASEATQMAAQLGPEAGPIIWFNNEEQGEKVQLRCIQAHFGLSVSELASDLDGYGARYHTEIGDRLRIVDAASISGADIERICERYQPSLVVIDQVDKLSGFDGDRRDLQLGAVYNWARELAKRFAPVIAVCQSDGTGEGVKWLTMSHVADAKTSKQAEADWILGIGSTNDEAFQYVRYLHLSKNKLIGDEDTNPQWRHDRWEVIIHPTIARYDDC